MIPLYISRNVTLIVRRGTDRDLAIVPIASQMVSKAYERTPVVSRTYILTS